MSEDPYDRLAVVGKAFASAKRLQVLDLLAQGERTVDAISRELGMGVSTVSAHLQILKLSELVATRREGTKVHYRLSGDDVAALYSALRAVARAHSADVDHALASFLDAGGVDDVQQISRAELVSRLDDPALVVLDVRPPEEFAAGHLPGAESVPLGELLVRARSLPGDVEVIAYCRGAWCVLAHDAVRLLHGTGREARRLEEGMLEWRTAGLPVEVA